MRCASSPLIHGDLRDWANIRVKMTVTCFNDLDKKNYEI